MLNEDMEFVQRNPRPAVIALAISVAAGFLIGWVLFSGSSETPAVVKPGAAVPTATSDGAAQGGELLTDDSLAAALEQGVAAVPPQDGTIQAGVALASGPWVQAGDDPELAMPGPMLRAAVAVAALRAKADDRKIAESIDDPGGCWTRINQPAQAVQDVLGDAGAGSSDATNPADCAQSSWPIGDAVAFAQALEAGQLGQEGATVLKLLRETDAPPWGARAALKDLDPAILTAWGGKPDEPLVVGQLATAHVGDQKVVVAAAFRSPAAGERDPAKAGARKALDAALGPLAKLLAQAQKASGG